MSKKLLKMSLYFTLLSTLASAINFAFYPIVSHLLSIAQFGDVQVGVSFVMLSAALLTSLSTLALFITASDKAGRAGLAVIERLVITLSVVLAILTIVFAEPVSSMLQLHDASLLYILAIIFILNIPASTWVGSIQGNGHFVASGWISVAASAIKLTAASIMIAGGLGAHGALLGIAIGTLMMLPLAKIFDSTDSIRYSETFKLVGRKDVAYFLGNKGALSILASLMIVAIVANIDIVVAKAILDPSLAGEYAQLSTLAKIPYFAGVPLALVLFGRYIDRSISHLWSFTIYTLIITFCGAVVVLFSQQLLYTLFNFPGTLDDSLLTPLTVGFVCYSVLILSAYRLIATGKTKRLLALAVFTIVTVSLFVGKSANAYDIAYGYMLGTLAALSLSMLLTYTKKHEQTSRTISSHPRT